MPRRRPVYIINIEDYLVEPPAPGETVEHDLDPRLRVGERTGFSHDRENRIEPRPLLRRPEQLAHPIELGRALDLVVVVAHVPQCQPTAPLTPQQ